MPTDFAQSVKSQADIVKIVGDYVRLRKAGAQNFSGLCPFHKEKTPSFSVHAGRQFFHCFGCGQSGDVFTFVQKMENIGFSEAVRAVAKKCGIPLPQREFTTPEEAAEHRQRGKLLELHETATAWFEEQLRSPEGAAAREYLSGRGLNPEAIAKFRIGYAPDDFHSLRKRLEPQADAATLRATGLFSWKDQEDGSPGPIYARFRKRVMFPICNEGGRVIAFTARTLETGEKAGPKYLNSPETPLYSKGQVLFNLDKARQPIRNDGGAVLVEGQMDCITVFLAGIRNVIATSGTAFTEMQVRLLRRYATRVIVNFDPDTAGSNAAEKSISLLTEEGFDVRVLTLEGGLDPDRFVRDRGIHAYAQALRAAPPFQDWLIDRARRLFPGRDPRSQTDALNFLLPHIRRIPGRIARDSFANDASQALGIDSALVRAELKDAAVRRREAVEIPKSFPLSFAEQTLLRAFSAPRSSEGYLAAERSWQEFESDLSGLRQDVREVIDQLRNRGVDQDPVVAIADEQKRQMFASIFMSVHDAEPQEADVDHAMLALRRGSLERLHKVKRYSISMAEKSGNVEEVIQLTKEIREIALRLKDMD